MNILVTGCTGLVGAEVLRQAVLNPDITRISAISRRQPPLSDAKIQWVRHDNFLDLTPLEDLFKQADAMVWCLGISQSQVNLEKYIEITCDYTRIAAETALKVHPEMRFVFCSGQGADPREKSRATFARYKGRAENILMNLGLKNVWIARPGGIRPVHKNPDTAFFNKIMIPFFPIMELFVPGMVISSVQLAQALLWLTVRKEEKGVSENRKLKELSAKYQTEFQM